MNILKYATSKKYRVFAKKMRDVQISIWELDFKIAKSRQIREGVRQDRERMMGALVNLEAAYKDEKDKARLATLDTEKAALTENARRYEAQIRMVDEQINGVAAEGDNPGQEGILDRIRALAELREMYKQYLTTI